MGGEREREPLWQEESHQEKLSKAVRLSWCEEQVSVQRVWKLPFEYVQAQNACTIVWETGTGSVNYLEHSFGLMPRAPCQAAPVCEPDLAATLFMKGHNGFVAEGGTWA